MNKPLTAEERQSFREYAKANMTEADGTQCQWADYTIRLLDENELLREEMGKLTANRLLHYATTMNRALAVVEAAKKAEKLCWDCMEEERSCGDMMNKSAAFLAYTAYKVLKEALAKFDGGSDD